MWSVPNHYPSSVTLSRSIFLSQRIRLLTFFYSKLTCFPAQPCLSEAG